MKMTEQEIQHRQQQVFLKKSDYEYYDLAFTAQHQKLCDDYLSGQYTDQEFNQKFFDIHKNK